MGRLYPTLFEKTMKKLASDTLMTLCGGSPFLYPMEDVLYHLNSEQISIGQGITVSHHGKGAYVISNTNPTSTQILTTISGRLPKNSEDLTIELIDTDNTPVTLTLRYSNRVLTVVQHGYRYFVV